MPLEIEKKYHVDIEKFEKEISFERSYRIVQGYILETDDKTSVRIRKVFTRSPEPRDSIYYLTVKEKFKDGTNETEDRIPYSIGEKLLNRFTGNKLLYKQRTVFKTNVKDVFIEVDQFLNKELTGLVIAEIEVPNEETFNKIELPDFITGEVVDEAPFKNINLIKRIESNG